MDLSRTLGHLCMTQHRLRRAFPATALAAVEQAIRDGEASHMGQLCFVVEGALDLFPLLAGQTARERAVQLFTELRVWDTEHNSGVLVYVLLADRAVEIVADRGIHARTKPHAWGSVCRAMESAFEAGHFQQGALRGIEAVSAQLIEHFPAQGGHANELPDVPVLL